MLYVYLLKKRAQSHNIARSHFPETPSILSISELLRSIEYFIIICTDHLLCCRSALVLLEAATIKG